MKLTALKCADKTWAGAGFNMNDRIVSLTDVDIIFDQGSGGLVAWGWQGLPEAVTSICGIPAFEYNKKSEPVKHPNGCISVDHVVLHSNDAEFVKAEFAKLQLHPRAVRDDIYPGLTQIFYRPGQGTVIEVVVNKDFPKAFLWGATVVVTDIDVAKNLLKENASEPKKAVQPGRKIMTVRHRNLHMETNMAMMTPHAKKQAKI